MSGTNYRPAPLVPRSPSQVREEMVRQRRTVAPTVPLADIERAVSADLQLVEALRRGQDSTRRKEGSPRSRPRRAEQALERDPLEGLRLVRPSGRFERTRALHASAVALGQKWSSAVARIGRIMEGASPSASPEKMVATAQCPELAMEWWNVYADFMLRHRTNRHNRFRGLSDRDAARKLIRLVMDICDRSTGKLGHWWVK